MKEEESLNNSMEDHQEADQINHRPHHHLQPYNGGGGGREDCWSEGATATLIEAWGDRYLQLSRGNLRQKDWKEVADAVNDRQDSVNKPRRTDIQCKNRIDTVKKKYKIEKAKSAPSKWPFYSRLDHLIGTTTTPASNKKFIQMPSRILRAKRNPNPNPNGVVFSGGSTASRSLKGIRNPNPNSIMYSGGSSRSLKGIRNPNLNPNGVAFSGGSSSKSRLKSEGLSESSDEGDDDDEVFDGGVKKHRMDTDSSDETAFRGLARAIAKFGEIYERIESSKQQQMMELERQKMELTKELEFQRMKMFMDTQLEIEKKKHSKYASGTGKKL